MRRWRPRWRRLVPPTPTPEPPTPTPTPEPPTPTPAPSPEPTPDVRATVMAEVAATEQTEQTITDAVSATSTAVAEEPTSVCGRSPGGSDMGLLLGGSIAAGPPRLAPPAAVAIPHDGKEGGVPRGAPPSSFGSATSPFPVHPICPTIAPTPPRKETRAPPPSPHPLPPHQSKRNTAPKLPPRPPEQTTNHFLASQLQNTEKNAWTILLGDNNQNRPPSVDRGEGGVVGLGGLAGSSWECGEA